MKKALTYLCAFFMVLFAGGIILTDIAPPAAAGEASHAIVTLKKMPNGISPNPVKVKVGATVIWINEEPVPAKIKVITKVGIACKLPANFYADPFGYYETSQIPQSGVAALCFIQKGAYNYEVKRMVNGTEEVSPGKVIVE
jgi:plastocyanin